MNEGFARRPSYFWMAMVLSLVLHLAFGSWFIPQMTGGRAQVATLPGLSFRSQAPGETRALYSPVLFALPTPMGFSASMLNQSLHSDPPIREQADTRSMLQVDDRRASSTPAQVFPDSRYSVETHFQNAPLDTAQVAQSWSAEDSPSGLAVRLDGPDLFRGRGPAEWLVMPDAGPEPWMAGMDVDIDREGRVKRVLLTDRPQNEALKAVLVRWMYRQQFSQGDAVAGQVVLRWTPPLEEGSP